MGFREIAGIGALLTAMARAITGPTATVATTPKSPVQTKPLLPIAKPMPEPKGQMKLTSATKGKTMIIIVCHKKTPI